MKEVNLQRIRRSINKHSSRLHNSNSMKKNRIVRNDTHLSDEMSANGKLDVNNPATGYINGNSNNARFQATIIKKPNNKQLVASETNSSYDENFSSSPYINPEKDYMLN